MGWTNPLTIPVASHQGTIKNVDFTIKIGFGLQRYWKGSIYVPKLGSKIGFPVSIQTHPWAHLVPARVGLFTVQATDWWRLADAFADHSSSTRLRLGPDLDGRQGGIVFCSKLPWRFHTTLFFIKGQAKPSIYWFGVRGDWTQCCDRTNKVWYLRINNDYPVYIIIIRFMLYQITIIIHEFAINCYPLYGH